MGRACRRGVYRLLVGTAERTTNGRPTNKWDDKTWDVGMDLINLAQDRDKWWVLVNAVMNLWVP
jgi:hypothetical protein